MTSLHDPLYDHSTEFFKAEQESRVAQRTSDENEKFLRSLLSGLLLRTTDVSTISHELRTPLNAIIGFGEILLEDGREEQVESLRKIIQAGRRLAVLIDCM